jgi:hypothetical protein
MGLPAWLTVASSRYLSRSASMSCAISSWKACVAGEAMRGGVASRTNAVGGNKAPANADTGARDSGSGVMGRGGTSERGPNIDWPNMDWSLFVLSRSFDAMFVES